jgi:hypothetical protein
VRLSPVSHVFNQNTLPQPAQRMHLFVCFLLVTQKSKRKRDLVDSDNETSVKTKKLKASRLPLLVGHLQKI